MPILDVVRSPRPIKPQLGIGLDYQRPMLDGLIAFLAMQEGGGPSTYTLPLGLPGTFQGTTPPIWTPQHSDGVALKFSGAAGSSASYLDFGSPAQFQDLAKGVPMSIAFRIGWSGVTAGGWAQKSGGSSTTGKGWEIGAQNNITFDVNFSGAANFRAVTSGTPYTGRQYQTVVITWDGLNATTSSHIYVDGIDFTSFPNGLGTGVQNSDSGLALQIGRNDQGGTTGGFQGEMSWVAIWNRVVTQPEALEMAVYPNVLFEFTTRRIGLLGGLPPVAANFIHNWLIS